MKRTDHGRISKGTYKKMGLLFLIVPLFFICAPFSSPGADKKKNVLIIHSYHQGFGWTDSITQGIESALNSSDQEIELFFEHMDTKRIHDEQHLQNLCELYRHKYRNRRFDVIISSDDHAFNFLLAHHREFFPGIPIVFCGVNNFEDSMLLGHDLITGVVESFDIKGTFEVALRLQPGIKQMFVIVDKTLSGRIVKELMIKEIPSFEDVLRFVFLEDLDIPEVLERVKNLPHDSAIFLISLLIDNSGNLFTFESSGALISQNSSVPIYSHSDVYLGHGILGGKLNCGDAQGQLAGEMASRILHGEKATNIPVVTKSPNRYKFDYQQMQRFGIKPGSLPEGSIVINRPYSFYAQHKRLIRPAIVAIVGLMVIIAILYVNILNRKRTEEALKGSEEKYRIVTESSPTGIFIHQDGRYVYVNKRFAELHGYEPEELLGKEALKLIPPDEREAIEIVISKRLKGEFHPRQYDTRRLKKDGKVIWVEMMADVIEYEGKPAIMGNIIDINARKKVEEAFRESELKFRLVTENIKDVFWMSTYGIGEMVYISPAYETLWERSRKSLYQSPRSFLEAVHNGDLKGYLGVLDEFHKNGKPYECEYRIIRRDGEIRWIHEKGYFVPHSWYGGKLMAGVCTDITERKRVEKALQNSEALHKEAQRVAHIGHWELGPDIGTPLWSDEIFRIFGLDPDEGEPPFTEHKKYVHPKDWPILDKAVRKAGREGTPFDLVFRIVKPGGEMGWMHVIGTTSMDDEGNVTKLFGIAQDITELRRAEEALIKREKELRLIADNVPALVSYVDGAGYYRFVNKKYEEWFAIPQKEIVGQHYGAVLGDDTYELIKETVEATLSGQRVRYEGALTYMHGGKRYVIADYVPDTDEYGKVKGFFALVTDITDRKVAEEELREKSLQVQRLADELELIIDGIPGLFFFKDTENRFIRVNKFVADAHQRTKKQLEGTSCFELYSREIAQAYYEDDLEVIRSRQPKLNIDETWETEYGTRWLNTSKIPYLNENGEVTGVIGLSLDITERKKAEEALRESEEKYRSLVESIVDSIYLVDRERRYIYTNKNYIQHFSLEINKVIGRSYDELHSKDETKEFKRSVNSVIETGKSHRYAYRSERGGRHYLRTLSPVKDLEGNIAAVTVISKDITELIKTERDLKKANEKLLREHNQRKVLSKRLIDLLEKDRRQVAMELHDHIGQILASLKMDIEMIHKRLKPGNRELGDRITAAQERTIQAIKDVKNISHGLRPGMLDALGLLPSLRELFNGIQQQTDIEIHFFNRNVPKRFAPEKELSIYRIAQEAMNNIVKYARAKKVFVNLVKKDEEVSLSIEDDGIGFDQEKIMQIPEKELALGLLIMRERAEQFDGEFTLESQSGKGTHLLVEIPL